MLYFIYGQAQGLCNDPVSLISDGVFLRFDSPIPNEKDRFTKLFLHFLFHFLILHFILTICFKIWGAKNLVHKMNRFVQNIFLCSFSILDSEQ